MKRIALLDTSICSTNRGDELIMSCIEEEMRDILEDAFLLRVPTHLSLSSFFKTLMRLPDSLHEISMAEYKFIGGTNLLQANMMNRTNQWDINLWNSRVLKGSICVGVGSNGILKGKNCNYYTKALYTKVLSNQFIHSTREDKASLLIENLGLSCLNTGCASLWKLTPSFCTGIPMERTDAVIFTLTDYNRDHIRDKDMILFLLREYKTVNIWLQGIYDYEYLRELIDEKTRSRIIVIPPSVEKYKEILSYPIDYVGTRLHAGIYALRQGRRAIILGLDDRMRSMQDCFGVNYVEREDQSMFRERVYSTFRTNIRLNQTAIDQWKGQFL